MHDPDQRFRRLRPPQPGDLFAHFGVPIDPAPSDPAATMVTARDCERCHWWVVGDGTTCDMCGAPMRAIEAAR